MGGERAETTPDELDRWVEGKAAELGVEREDVVRRALAAYRLVETNEDIAAAPSSDVDERVERLDDRVGDLEADLDEKITDVRERVVQVKRESDRKAPEEHEHREITSGVEDALAAVESAREAVSAVEDRMEAGFGNYENVLEHLVDATEETEQRVDAVARSVVDLRERTRQRERAVEERRAASDLKREANRKGVTAATCGDCGGDVDIALLDAPYCPHCEESFDGVHRRRRFFGSARLTTGRRPALEGPGNGESPSDEDAFEQGEP